MRTRPPVEPASRQHDGETRAFAERLSTDTVPPIATQMFLTTHSPMPNPPLRCSTPRSNRSKIRVC